MRRHRWLRSVLLSMGVTSLAACVSVPKPLQGEFPAATPESAQAAQMVRWGGSIVAVEPEATRTCLQILARPLGGDARPRAGDEQLGRFLACKAGFLDPAVFTVGRELTLTGVVGESRSVYIGEYAYRMPEVAIATLFLWPERPPPMHGLHPAPAYFGPWGWDPWAPPRVIVLPQREPADQAP